MQKKNKKIIGFGIVLVAVIILLLLLIFFKCIVNKQNQVALYENTTTMLVGSKPNAPKLSAGMIPVKWNGENFVITTSNDKGWYNTQPAYVMLNDGTYQSELVRDMTNKKLANENVNVDIIEPEKIGTIFMWIPRFVYNKAGEIGYIKEETTPRRRLDITRFIHV